MIIVCACIRHILRFEKKKKYVRHRFPGKRKKGYISQKEKIRSKAAFSFVWIGISITKLGWRVRPCSGKDVGLVWRCKVGVIGAPKVGEFGNQSFENHDIR